MRICIPGQVVVIGGCPMQGAPKAICGVPINGHYDFAPSIFWDEDGRDENACCHAALHSPHLIDGEEFIMAGGCDPKGRVITMSGPCDFRVDNYVSYLSSYPVGDSGGVTVWGRGGTSSTWRAEGVFHQQISYQVVAYGTKDGTLDSQGRGRWDSVLLASGMVCGYANWRTLHPGEVSIEGGRYPFRGVWDFVNPGPYRSTADLRQSIVDLMARIVMRCAPIAQKWAETATGRFRETVGCIADLPAAPKTQDFLLDEWDRLVGGYPVATTPNRGYALQWLKQHAYLDAVQSAPSLSDNSISNILELIGVIKDLVHGEVTIPKRWQDAWLAYRYQYMTTKLDLEEAVAFFKRMSNLSSLNAKTKSYGSSTYIVGGHEVTCRCKVEIAPKSINGFDKLWGHLSRLGLSPDSYVIWDMTPFSFMVDWLIPIGDVLDVFDTSVLTESYWDISNITYSLSYELTDRKYPVKCYTRWRGDGPLELNELYWFDKSSASSKIKLFRLLDTASLFIGG